MRIILTFIFYFMIVNISLAQNDTALLKHGRVKAVAIGGGILYGTSLAGLYQLWYKNYPHSSFHLFNDNNEWLQMDKLGHFTTSYNIGKVGISMMNWTGINRKKAIWLGGISGLVFLTNIEILDGFSNKWGFSIGDMISNTMGSALVISQALAWNDQRIKLRFSFHQTSYSKYRPDELGYSLNENIIKDYNGQTYWLSGNIFSFCKNKSKFPKWINIALGYGGEGMLGGMSNPSQINGVLLPVFSRVRQFYLSFDVDLSRVNTKSKFLKKIFGVIDFIKIPTPSLMLDTEGHLKLYPIYF